MLNRTESYQYDLAGNLARFTDRKNQVATFQYDALNRRTTATYADATTTFTYDIVGRLAKASDTAPGAGMIDFTYDILDRLTQEATEQGSVAYQYDVLGRRTQMTANGQQPTTYQYDAASQLIQVAQGAQIVGLSYDATGRRTSLTYPNSTNTNYTYDNASRLTNIAHQGPAGVIESLSYVYDAAGNRISLSRSNGTASNLPAAAQAAYDAANEQGVFNGLPATFDANGNLTTSADATGTTTYAWDARNRLIARSGSGINESYAYNASGRRISKTMNGVTTQFLYDGKDIVTEISGGTVSASYVRSLNIDEPFVRRTAAGNEFYHVDALGSTLGLTNQTGAVQASYHYEAFGKTTVAGTSSSPFQFTGRENDGTGLYYYRARYYSFFLHRFVSEDPIRFSLGTQNLYPYVLNNPVTATDPSGEIPLFGRYCGVGSFPGQPYDDLDNACKEHDLCYGEIGIDAGTTLDPARNPNLCKKADDCDDEICKRARKYVPKGAYAKTFGVLAQQYIIFTWCD